MTWQRSTARRRTSGWLNPRWQATRKRILRRDRGICQECGAPATSVDHRRRVGAGGTDDDANLVSLCTRCHSRKSGREGAAVSHDEQHRERRVPERHPGLVDPTGKQ